MLISIVPAASASDREWSTTSWKHENCAMLLEDMGLFNGTANGDYELYRAATRSEALVMLIRILGKENNAKWCTDKHNFADVPEGNWAYPYVAYGYKKGYASGTSKVTFEPNAYINLDSYITFMLRALGYSDKNGDFKYNEALEKAEKIGMVLKNAYYSGDDPCLRDDCVYLTVKALNTKMKNSDFTLGEFLSSQGVFSKDMISEIAKVVAGSDYTIGKALKNNHKVRPVDTNTFDEYDESWKRISSMYYNFYGDNPAGHRATYFTYNSSNKVKEVCAISGFVMNMGIKKYNYVEGKLTSIDGETGCSDGTTFHKHEFGGFITVPSYKYEYDSNGVLKKIFDEGFSEEYVVEYSNDGKTAYVNDVSIPRQFTSPGSIFFDCTVNMDKEQNEYIAPFGKGITKVVFEGVDRNDNRNKYKLEFCFNDDGTMKKTTFYINGYVYYVGEYNSYGKLKREENYRINYEWVSNVIALSSIAVGSELQETSKYNYNDEGLLTEVEFHNLLEDNRFSALFTYYGNKKLNRAIAKNRYGISLVYRVCYDDKGNVIFKNQY